VLAQWPEPLKLSIRKENAETESSEKFCPQIIYNFSVRQYRNSDQQPAAAGWVSALFVQLLQDKNNAQTSDKIVQARS
jgi:hypothetical protein